MNSHATEFLHWWWAAFFIVFGVYLIWQREWATPRIACGIRISNEQDRPACERIAAAIKSRQDAEGPPFPLGFWTGVPAIALGLVAALTSVQPALLYSLICLTVAATSAVAYLRLRNSQPRRVAVLSKRQSGAVIPAYWFGIAAISCVSPLAFVTTKQYTISALVVFAASAIVLGIAYRLTELPALLSGADIPAERLVDDHLRFARSAAALVYALVQTFVFCSQVQVHSVLQGAAIAYNWFPWIAFGIWMVWRMRRPHELAIA